MVDTLFESWRKANTLPAPTLSDLPPQFASQENPYLQALKLAEVREQTFYQRQKRRVNTWFHYHPECRQVLLPLDWREVQLRGEENIDISERYGCGWGNKVQDAGRPEHHSAQTDTLDDPIAMAVAMSSRAYMAEMLAEYPLPKPRKKKTSPTIDNKKQLAFDLSL